MATSTEIYKGKSKMYKGVYIYECKGKLVYKGIIGKQAGGNFTNEREAAIFCDKALINQGKEPVNILIRK